MSNADSVAGSFSVEVSGDGKRNAFHFQCDILGNQQAYASCVDKIGRRKHGALPVIYSICSAAIGKKSCPAVAMRKEELGKGQAIYFLERQRFTGLAALVDKAKQVFSPKKAPAKPLPVEPTPAIAGDYMAQALNAAFESHQTAPKTEVRPGETMLEAARRMLASRNSQT